MKTSVMLRISQTALSLCLCISSLLLNIIAHTSDSQQILSWEDAVGETCRVLSTTFQQQIYFAGDQPYSRRQSEYWTAQQSGLSPACFFLPSNATDIRDALEILIKRNTSFAVVSGGHTSNTGASNIDRGVTIDLSSLADVPITSDGEAVTLGAGARWSDVHSALDPYGLTVAGGRVGHVGVGGYVLGGGLSWFPNEIGWSCDGAPEMEVVTPDLRILTVNENLHGDLFWSLKGSLGAFGIVTKIRMRTIKTSGIYAGAITYDEKYVESVFAALAKMTLNSENDPFTNGYISTAYIASEDKHSCLAYLVNTEARNTSDSLADFHDIPHMHSSMQHTTFQSSAEEISKSNPLGLRRSKFTFTTMPSVEIMQSLHRLFRERAANISSDPKALIGMLYQPLTRQQLQNQNNIFKPALTSKSMPLLIVAVELWWEDRVRDVEFVKFMRALEKDMTGPNVCRWQCFHGWVYPNYAALWQEPLQERRLGTKTWKALQRVRETYDPDGVWARLVPGIWHV